MGSGMHMPEKLPAVIPLSALETEERMMIQVDTHLLEAKVSLHGHLLKTAEETLPDIFEVMVTHDKMNLTIQAIQHLRPFGGATQAKITQMEHRILRTNNLVPITNEYLIHFLHIPEGTITKPDNIRMMKMRIRGEKQMIRV